MSGSANPAPLSGRWFPPALSGLALLFVAWLPVIPVLAYDPPAYVPLLMQGGLAFLLMRVFGLPIWWQIIGLTFFPLAWLLTYAQLPSAWYLGALALLILTSAGALSGRVPLFLSSQAAVRAVAKRLPSRNGIAIIDLGCGLGGWLANLKKLRPDLRLTGVEVAPLNWLASRLRLHGRAQVRLGSLWDADLSGFDVVYAYLSPAPMDRLWRKVQREMRPGSLFISNSFPVTGVEPDEIVDLDDLAQSRLLIWRR